MTDTTFSKVLLIDDSEIDTLVNRRLIQITSFASEVITLSSAEEGLHYLIENCPGSEDVPDIIFLDMNLPLMNGYEFIEHFKKMPDYILEKSRLIILSVYQNQEKLNQVLDLPFVAGQLEKPLNQQALNELKEQKSVFRNAE